MDGMPVESGYHRMLGSYSALPDLLARAGVAVDDIVCWEDEVEIRSSDGTSASSVHPLFSSRCGRPLARWPGQRRYRRRTG
jgi:hypothetical protein